ncbi:MAG: DUF2147 domain-containing protein [Polyangia bacterium]|jgi:uncharacterized protein (DUF2147 family)
MPTVPFRFCCSLAIVGVAAVCSSPVRATAGRPADPDAILGVWLTSAQDATITITRSGDSYVGHVSWLKRQHGADGQPVRDDHNPDVSLRQRPLMGLQILWGMRSKGDGEYTDGQLYDPAHGKTYSGKAVLVSDHVLQLRGYVGISLFGRTETWTRK